MIHQDMNIFVFGFIDFMFKGTGWTDFKSLFSPSNYKIMIK